MVLHSVHGGAPGGFHIGHEQHSHYCFSVASKEVSFLVYSQRCITTRQFNVYFLSHGGGANWMEDHQISEREQQGDWMTMSRRKKKAHCKHVTFSSPIKQPTCLRKSQTSFNPFSFRVGEHLCSTQNLSSTRNSSCFITNHHVIPVQSATATLRRDLRLPEKAEPAPATSPELATQSRVVFNFQTHGLPSNPVYPFVD